MRHNRQQKKGDDFIFSKTLSFFLSSANSSIRSLTVESDEEMFWNFFPISSPCRILAALRMQVVIRLFSRDVRFLPNAIGRAICKKLSEPLRIPYECSSIVQSHVFQGIALCGEKTPTILIRFPRFWIAWHRSREGRMAPYSAFFDIQHTKEVVFHT
jgi:hypothetical protein